MPLPAACHGPGFASPQSHQICTRENERNDRQGWGMSSAVRNSQRLRRGRPAGHPQTYTDDRPSFVSSGIKAGAHGHRVWIRHRRPAPAAFSVSGTLFFSHLRDRRRSVARLRNFAAWRSPEFRPTSAQISLRSFVPNAPKFRPYFIEMRSTTQRGNFMCNRQGEDMRATFLHTYLLTVHLYLLTYPTERLSYMSAA